MSTRYSRGGCSREVREDRDMVGRITREMSRETWERGKKGETEDGWERERGKTDQTFLGDKYER